jgi:hypothetical protein
MRVRVFSWSKYSNPALATGAGIGRLDLALKIPVDHLAIAIGALAPAAIFWNFQPDAGMA